MTMRLSKQAKELFGVEQPVGFNCDPAADLLAHHIYHPSATTEVPDGKGGWKTVTLQALFGDKEAVAAWHTVCYNLQDPFTGGGRPGPFGGQSKNRKENKARLRLLYEFMVITGKRLWCLHDLDVIWKFRTPAEYVANMEQVAEDIVALNAEFAEYGIGLAWVTSALFSQGFHILGAFTSTTVDPFEFAALQLKSTVDLGVKVGARGGVLWLGRDGGQNGWLDQLDLHEGTYNRLLKDFVEYAKAKNPKVVLLSEPKGREPSALFQRDRDAMTTLYNLQRAGVLDRVGLNLEPFAHGPMAGADPFAEMLLAVAHGRFWSVDINSQPAVVGWDDDNFLALNPLQSAQLAWVATMPGVDLLCYNNDARIRVSSIDYPSLVHGHVASRDALAAGFAAASLIRKSGILDEMVAARRREWESGRGQEILQGKHGGLEGLAARALSRTDLPTARPGHFERVQHKLQPYLVDSLRGLTYA